MNWYISYSSPLSDLIGLNILNIDLGPLSFSQPMQPNKTQSTARQIHAHAIRGRKDWSNSNDNF